MVDGSVDGGGKKDWMGEWRMAGSNSLKLRMLLDRSMTDSKMYPHSLGQGLTPNIRQRAMRRKEEPLMDACERDLEVILDFK